MTFALVFISGGILATLYLWGAVRLTDKLNSMRIGQNPEILAEKTAKNAPTENQSKVDNQKQHNDEKSSSHPATYLPIDTTLPPIVETRVFNNGIATIVNVGKSPIRDIQIDVSDHTVDKVYQAPGTDAPPPQVTGSSFWSSPFQVRLKTLNSGQRDQFDLKRMAQWNEIPHSQEAMNAVSPERLDEIFRTFFVFRFTFRHAITGEKYACYRVHGSYLEFPSQIDDNVSQAGPPSVLRFRNSLRNVLIETAKLRYTDGAKEISCD